jgi:hypothetical protein
MTAVSPFQGLLIVGRLFLRLYGKPLEGAHLAPSRPDIPGVNAWAREKTLIVA